MALLVAGVAAAAFIAAALLGFASVPLLDVGGGSPHPKTVWDLVADVGGGSPHPH